MFESILFLFMDPEIVPGRTRGVKIIRNFDWSRWQGKRGSLKQY